jgi:hypothetical protein
MNYAPGRYMYEIGVEVGGNNRVYRQGVLMLIGSPYATGADPVTINGAPLTVNGVELGVRNA